MIAYDDNEVKGYRLYNWDVDRFGEEPAHIDYLNYKIDRLQEDITFLLSHHKNYNLYV